MFIFINRYFKNRAGTVKNVLMQNVPIKKKNTESYVPCLSSMGFVTEEFPQNISQNSSNVKINRFKKS